ncbi:hypothetical protein CEN47_08560 [Fischerella thermalis CCMEE 5319]|nr:hypothetical protein CEN47_08560 [Fischerella thermalis CCMEE 5319]
MLVNSHYWKLSDIEQSQCVRGFPYGQAAKAGKRPYAYSYPYGNALLRKRGRGWVRGLRSCYNWANPQISAARGTLLSSPTPLLWESQSKAL